MLGSGTLATKAVEMSGPTPGIASRLRLRLLVRCQASTRRSISSTQALISFTMSFARVELIPSTSANHFLLAAGFPLQTAAIDTMYSERPLPSTTSPVRFPLSSSDQ